MFHEVLVPFNGSEETMRALRIGAGLAQTVDAGLRILAYEQSPHGPSLTAGIVQTALDTARVYDVEVALTRLDPKQFPSDAIISEAGARPESVICMATHGRGRSQVFTGSVSSEVVLYGPGAVVLCGPECEKEFLEHHGPMLVGLDGSSEAEHVIAVADKWAQALGVPLEIVNVLPVRQSPELAAAVATGDVLESGYVSRVASSEPALRGHDVTYDVLHGKPADAILEEARARNASMIATATHMRLGVDRLIHGSVTAEIVRKSPVPVLAYCAHPYWAATHPDVDPS